MAYSPKKVFVLAGVALAAIVLTLGVYLYAFAPLLFVSAGTHFFSLNGFSASPLYTQTESEVPGEYDVVREESLLAAIRADFDVRNWWPIQVSVIEL